MSSSEEEKEDEYSSSDDVRWALLSLLAAFLKFSRASRPYQSSSLRSSVIVDKDGTTVLTTVTAEKVTELLRRFGDVGGGTTVDMRCRSRQLLS